MPRRMPPLAQELRSRVVDAIGLVRAGELARANAGAGSVTWRELHVPRLEILYEIAFLRVFIAWEIFLEETFHRYLCGFESGAGPATLQPTMTYARTLADAESLVLGGNPYKLWHNPQKVIQRSKQFFKDAPHELVLASHMARLEGMANVRHRVAHAHADVRQKFNNATMMFCGRRYRGERAGRFLRDFDPSATPPVRWLETLGTELYGIAAQIG